MAPLSYFTARKVPPLYLLIFLFSSLLLLSSSSSSVTGDNGDHHELQFQGYQFLGTRRLLEKLEDDDEEIQIPKKKSTNLSSKNQTKLIKSNLLSTKNQTKLSKPNLSSKNQTKLTKPTNSTKATISEISKSELKKLNSTSIKLKKLNSTSKASNSTKASLLSSKKSSDLLNLSSPKNKTTKPTSPKSEKPTITEKNKDSSESKKNQNAETKKPNKEKTQKILPFWLDQEDDDLVSEFRDLPIRFQQTLLPDLEKISTTSKAYITKANKQITRGFKPYVGNKYAPTIASFVSLAFILIPLVLVSLIFNRFKAYFSLQKILIFIQVYLSIYFTILCFSSLVTGLEPLKFFYATSQSTYICVQVMQTLGYVLYLLLLLMYLVLVFSTDCGLGLKLLGLAQTFVGFAVGLHYYVAVFHRVVLHQPPKTNWKVHGIYATCFLLICLFSRAERRKKAYLEEGGEEGKKN